MVSLALRQALAATESQGAVFGELAGAEVLQLAEDRGLDTSANDIYSRVIHIAALSDILVSAIRKPTDDPWIIPPVVKNWKSDCLMSPDGKYLRRIALVSHWTDERHYSECRSWFSLGEMAHYNLPMQMIVLVIGQERCGKRLSPWTSGFLHPLNRQLRFRKKKSRLTAEVFNDKWEKIWREDHGEIPRETWLNSMLKDDVLPEVCFKVDIPLPGNLHLARVRDMASSKLEQLSNIRWAPEGNLSTCDWPSPCVFRKLCHSFPQREPSGRNGYLAQRAAE